MIIRSGHILACAAALLVSHNAMALSFSVNAHDDGYGVSASQTIFPMLRAGVGYFSSDYSGRRATVYTGSLMFSPYLPVVDLEVGARYQYQDTHYGDGGGVGLGGSLFVPTPIPLTTIGGYGFYTPEGLSHGDLKKSYEYGAEARVKIVAQTYAFGGYRHYRTDFAKHGEKTLNKGFVLGVSAGF